ncbi:MAG TPA: hypothetical protein VII92_03735 [Anaerolineae bacterium]
MSNSIPLRTTQLGEVLTPELLAKHAEHIRNFLIFENVPFDPHQLATTSMTERQIKELLEELAAEG